MNKPDLSFLWSRLVRVPEITALPPERRPEALLDHLRKRSSPRFFLLMPAPEMSPDLCARWMERILRLFELVAASGIRYQDHNFAAMQMEGLYMTARLFPEVEGVETWRRFIRGTLQATILRAFREDGGQWEQSPAYHSGCLVWYGSVVLLGLRNDEHWSDLVLDRMEKAADYLEACILPDGCLAPFGDSDRRPFWKDSLPLVAALLPEKRFPRKLPPSWTAVWLGLPSTSAGAQSGPRSAPGTVFPQSGYAIVRTGQGNGASCLGFRNGPNDAGHAHADNLSFFWDAIGAPALVDSGRWMYDNSHRHHRGKGVWAHNSVFPDIESRRFLTPERIEEAVGKDRHLQRVFTHENFRRAAILVENCPDRLRLESVFRGYVADAAAQAHRRIVVSLSEDRPWILVIDRLYSPAPLRWIENWVIAAEAPPAESPDGLLTFNLPGERRLQMRMACQGAPLSRLERETYWCSNYGEPTPARQVVCSAETAADLRAFLFGVSPEEVVPPELALTIGPEDIVWKAGRESGKEGLF